MCTRIAWHVDVIHGLGLCASEVILVWNFKLWGNLYAKWEFEALGTALLRSRFAAQVLGKKLVLELP